METIYLPEKKRWDTLCKRPGIDKTDLEDTVRGILNRVKYEKDNAIYDFLREI